MPSFTRLLLVLLLCAPAWAAAQASPSKPGRIMKASGARID
ncbi:MAG TPA: hypothetical protein VFX67_02220 [Burkholderiales bacterium]|nr:hypothetical protein [Burkholderiales bacterium]